MAKCKCGTRPRIVSSVVRSINNSGSNCLDVCANPICGDPNMLGIFAPLIYDEIGINLCTTFELGVDIAATYPTVTNATIQVVGASFAVNPENVTIEAINGRPNCYLVTLTSITVQFAMKLYDSACRLVATIYPAAEYLPADTSSPTYNEDTNPSSVELEIFAPYGLSYDAGTLTPTVNYIGFDTVNNSLRQGINMYSMAKILDFSTDDSTATVGLTLVLQSLYFVGYKVKSAGKIDVPKGSILSPDNSDCMRFVAGDLLNLAIKPLDLGAPMCEENYKQECCNGNSSNACGGCLNCNTGNNACGCGQDCQGNGNYTAGNSGCNGNEGCGGNGMPGNNGCGGNGMPGNNGCGGNGMPGNNGCGGNGMPGNNGCTGNGGNHAAGNNGCGADNGCGGSSGSNTGEHGCKDSRGTDNCGCGDNSDHGGCDNVCGAGGAADNTVVMQ